MGGCNVLSENEPTDPEAVAKQEAEARTQRKHVRSPLRAKVKLNHDEFGEMELFTKNLSDGGLYVFAEDEALPGIGQLVTVQVQGLPGGDAPLCKMEVVRQDPKGIGLEFVLD